MYVFNYKGGSFWNGKFIVFQVINGQEVFLSDIPIPRHGHMHRLNIQPNIADLFGRQYPSNAPHTIINESPSWPAQDAVARQPGYTEVLTAFVKIFLQWESSAAVGRSRSNYSFYFQISKDPESGNKVTVRHPTNPELFFTARGRFLLKKEIKEILNPLAPSQSFIARQQPMRKEDLKRIITIEKEKPVAYAAGRRIFRTTKKNKKGRVMEDTDEFSL
jgi:hypothetical protein